MRALVTNDDGIDSPGLAVLARAALAAGYEVTVAAPSREWSGASAALRGDATSETLAFAERRAPGLPDGVPSYAIDAAPALIAFLACQEGDERRPDLVLSGVNLGPNTGDVVVHSGTVGAAIAAALRGVRAVAVSIDSMAPTHWGTAEQVVARVLPWVAAHEPGALLNVNVPDVPPAELRGVVPARLARHAFVSARVEPAGDGTLHVTYRHDAAWGAGVTADSDVALLAAGYATLTLVSGPVTLEADLPRLEGPLG